MKTRRKTILIVDTFLIAFGVSGLIAQWSWILSKII